ncbi:hypothetical protein [Demequina litorisediminis]|uniref:Uncharacterized protein n=1 Tax=Demequina litorisediminis TaxID=1849022 RepID=A0ABQ6IJ57_9MICO|nr:hypothetical protein [Demequina litorisediminis]GMA33862.1 hypothetical protein GCM10025876_00660 [Demequina litorisediminis]GMA37759.1 hypothetical protein GCM10025876_39630 [Demequina litorisediminis]
MVRRRSEAGWQVADALAGGATRREAARALAISPQAVSQRAAVAMLDEEAAARPLAARLVTDAGVESDPSGTVPSS